MKFAKKTAGLMGIVVLIYLVTLETNRRALSHTTSDCCQEGGDEYTVVGVSVIPADAVGQFVWVNPEARLPNDKVEKVKDQGDFIQISDSPIDAVTGKWQIGRVDYVLETVIESGTLSPHYGEIQRERQQWLMEKAQNLRVTLGIAPTPASGETAAVAAQSVPPKDVSNVTKSSPPPSSHDVKSTALRSGTNGSESNFPEQAARTNDAAVAAAVADGEGGDGNHAQPARLRRGGLRGKGEGREEEGGGRRNARRVVLEKASAAGKAEVPEELEGGTATTEERVKRVELGAELWDATYVPSIEPGRRQELIKKWSPPGGQQGNEKADLEGGSKGRILFVVSSFDRGRRLGRLFRGVDKADYVFLMMDEMREACEVGFSVHVHFIAAWDPSEVGDFIRDRLYCERIGDFVPYSYEEHSPSIGNTLSIKHRVFMKPLLQDYDVFIQVEDDMILTLNHILLYLEYSHKLKYRKGEGVPDFSMMPGFIRVEPSDGKGNEGIGEEWFEWEILLSRFKGVLVKNVGTYMTLGPSRVLPHAGNNQGLWMATQDQLQHLVNKCQYLNFNRDTKGGHVEMHSGSIQMFQRCGIEKAFPSVEFEGFLVHHRTNNKNGYRGESVPAVPISMLRVWNGQFLRDSGYLQVKSRRRLR